MFMFVDDQILIIVDELPIVDCWLLTCVPQIIIFLGELQMFATLW